MMKTKFGRYTAVLLIISVFLVNLSMNVSAAEGFCDETKWAYNSGILTISGQGNMADYVSASDTPWFGIKDEITSVVVGSGVKQIGQCSFSELSKLNTVTMADSVVRICDYAFEGCERLSSIKFSESIVDIGNNAFDCCASLSSITLPNKLVEIKSESFKKCVSLSEINIPATTKKINGSAFASCKNLKRINVDENNATYCDLDGVLYKKDMTEIVAYPNGKATEYAIADSVKTIGASAFFECGSLKSVTIPNSIEKIESSAFKSCKNLTEVSIAGTAKYIGVDAFMNCTTLKNVTIGTQSDSGKLELLEGCFDGCTAMENVYIGNSVTLIKKDSFRNCVNLESITLPSSLEETYSAAFYGCTKLREIQCDENNAFFYDADGVLYSKDKTILVAYPYAKGGEYIIENGTKKIAADVFRDNKNITDIILPDSLEELESGVFLGCTGLTSITLPENVNAIGNNVFSGCTQLTEIVFPDKLEMIGNDALSYCNNLQKVEFGKSLNSIGEFAFAWCDSLTEIEIPENTVAIGWEAFYNCKNLKSVKIGDGLSAIGNYAFGNCISLNEIKIPDSVTTVGNGAFYGCKSLTHAKLGKGMTEIGLNLFADCSSLKTVIIPNSVQKIYDTAFISNTVSFIDKVTFIGHKGSFAEKYATENSIAFSVIDPIRLSGKDRYETSAVIVQNGWETADTIILASSDVYADALAAAPLSSALNAPILLTNGESLELSIIAEIERLNASKVIILGGAEVISSEFGNSLMSKYAVERIFGADRFETSVLIAQKVNPTPQKAIIVTGNDFADAVSVSAYAAYSDIPVIYADKNGGLNESAVAYLQSAQEILIIGGETIVTPSVEKQLTGKSIKRIFGSDRYQTSLKISSELGKDLTNGIVISSGADFASALSLASFCAGKSLNILLVDSGSLSNEAENFIENIFPSDFYIAGGEDGIPTSLIVNIY